MKKLLVLLLFSNLGFTTNYTLESGWNLLGSSSTIPTSNFTANSNVRNIVIYQNGQYKSTANNEFSTIPANSGFWIYTDSQISVEVSDNNFIPTNDLKKLDSSLNEVANDATSWDILEVVGADLYFEMKTNSFLASTTYTGSEANNYCNNLIIGALSNWRLPLAGELEALSSLYLEGSNSNYFLIKSDDSFYRSSDYDKVVKMNGSSVDNYSYDSYNFYTICVHNK